MKQHLGFETEPPVESGWNRGWKQVSLMQFFRPKLEKLALEEYLRNHSGVLDVKPSDAVKAVFEKFNITF